MSKFLACLCDKNYSVLGNGTDVELSEAWMGLIGQYYELKGDKVGSVAEWKLSRDITRLQNHLFLTSMCVTFLWDQYSESVAESLCKLGYAFAPKDKNPLEYHGLLTSIVTRSKAKEIQLQGFYKEMKKITDNKHDVVNTREAFEETLSYIEEMQKISYDFDTLTVYKYVILEKKLINKIEKSK